MVVFLGNVFVVILIIAACVIVLAGMGFFVFRLYLAVLEALDDAKRDRERRER